MTGRAEALNSLFKGRVHPQPRHAPQRRLEVRRDVEISVAEYVDWFNHRRLHGEIGLVPPAEFEANHWATITTEHYPQTPAPTGAGSN